MAVSADDNQPPSINEIGDFFSSLETFATLFNGDSEAVRLAENPIMSFLNSKTVKDMRAAIKADGIDAEQTLQLIFQAGLESRGDSFKPWRFISLVVHKNRRDLGRLYVDETRTAARFVAARTDRKDKSQLLLDVMDDLVDMDEAFEEFMNISAQTAAALLKGARRAYEPLAETYARRNIMLADCRDAKKKQALLRDPSAQRSRFINGVSHALDTLEKQVAGNPLYKGYLAEQWTRATPAEWAAEKTRKVKEAGEHYDAELEADRAQNEQDIARMEAELAATEEPDARVLAHFYPYPDSADREALEGLKGLIQAYGAYLRETVEYIREAEGLTARTAAAAEPRAADGPG